MKVLVTEDEMVSAKMLDVNLSSWNYDVLIAHNGLEAWQHLQNDNDIHLLLVDWIMPIMDGATLCKKIRTEMADHPIYIIMITVKNNSDDLILGLESGADEFITKPFRFEELHARIRAGERIIKLQLALSDRLRQLEEAVDHIKHLQKVLPICSYCKKIRTDKDYWQQLESYFTTHGQMVFSHSICPTCYDKYLKPQLEELEREGDFNHE